MKTIIGLILMAIVLIGSGAGAYTYLSQASTTVVEDFEHSGQLGLLIDDCFVLYAPECLHGTAGQSEEVVIKAEIEKLLLAQQREDLISYAQTPTDEEIRKLDPERFFPVTTYTFPATIARVSEITRVNYKLLLAISALGPTSWLDQPLSPNTAVPLVSRYLGLANELRGYMNTPLETKEILILGKRYPLADTLNPGSRAVYAYFADHAPSIEEFERISGLRENSRSLSSIWMRLFGEEMLTESPYFVPTE